jgi:hypothetical protein
MEEDNDEYISMPDNQEAEEYDGEFVKDPNERDSKGWGLRSTNRGAW